ncbi:MAG: hypothetical protein AB1832_06515 [Pseudomonadota bacterium]
MEQEISQSFWMFWMWRERSKQTLCHFWLCASVPERKASENSYFVRTLRYGADKSLIAIATHCVTNCKPHHISALKFG